MTGLLDWWRRSKIRLNGLLTQIATTMLGVLLAFWLDSYREKVGEQGREREYIKSMINDVVQDTLNSTAIIEDFNRRIEGINGFREHFRKWMYGTCEPYFESTRYWTGWADYHRTKGTIDQLNSGGYLLIRSKPTRDGIAAYDIAGEDVLTETEDMVRHIYNLWDASKNVINYMWIDSMRGGHISDEMIRCQPTTEMLLTTDKTLLNKFFGGFGSVSRRMSDLVKVHQAHITRGRELIGILKREYNLDED